MILEEGKPAELTIGARLYAWIEPVTTTGYGRVADGEIQPPILLDLLERNLLRVLINGAVHYDVPPGESNSFRMR